MKLIPALSTDESIALRRLAAELSAAICQTLPGLRCEKSTHSIAVVIRTEQTRSLNCRQDGNGSNAVARRGKETVRWPGPCCSRPHDSL